MNIMSKSMRVVLWFAVNSDEELSAEDIHVKWGLNPQNLLSYMKGAIDAGLLKHEVRLEKSSGNGRRTYYMAGPELLREISK